MNIQPWQKDLLDKMAQYKGKGVVQITGRQMGKSALNALNRLFQDVYSQPLIDIRLSEGKVYGARYYTAEPLGGDWHEMERWCVEMFGSAEHSIWAENKAPEPEQRWYANNRKFWFRSEMDRTIFILKWR